LRQRGVVFESDSEEEEPEESGKPSAARRRMDPLWRPQKSQNVFDIDPSLDWRDPENRHATHGTLPPGQMPRPSKKQIVGHLLKYQCRERRRKYGDPHREVDRNLDSRQVTAVERRLVHPQGDPFEVSEVESEMKKMSFRDFIGIPEIPVVVQGKGREELAYREGKIGLVRNARGTARRVVEEEKFPFVYKTGDMRT